MILSEFIDLLKLQLNAGRPGIDYQYKMSPLEKMPFIEKTSFITAGILILLVESGGIIKTILIKRPKYEGVHSNQVAFPGGKSHPDDVDIIHTALRETKEELGIPENRIKIVGTLTDFYIAVSNINVTPVIGYLTEDFIIKPDMREVEYYKIFDLLHLAIHEPEYINSISMQIYTGEEMQVPYYSISEEKVWGATAMIISELLELIRRSIAQKSQD